MNTKKFWNERYQSESYLYGVEANTFLRDNIGLLREPVLSIAEGEGRNAVYMASQGLSVLGVDYSETGLKKAEALAQANGVEIETKVTDLMEFQPENNYFGAVVSIFAHLPSAIRNRLYPRVESSLKSGGIFLLEAYSENQLARDTGGPKDLDMLMTVEKLQQEFQGLTPILAREIEREVKEGSGHTGIASVVQFIARKLA